MTDTPVLSKTYSIEYLVAAFIVGLIGGVLVSWLWLGSLPQKTKSETVNSVSTSTVNTEANLKDIALSPSGSLEATPKKSVLLIDDQPAGSTVFIAKADIDENSWVVIHEDHSGLPGRALGAARFIGGATSGTVELLRNTALGQTYHGLIYKDDGDHVFSMERDVPLRDEAGNPVVVTFKTK